MIILLGIYKTGINHKQFGRGIRHTKGSIGIGQ